MLQNYITSSQNVKKEGKKIQAVDLTGQIVKLMAAVFILNLIPQIILQEFLLF